MKTLTTLLILVFSVCTLSAAVNPYDLIVTLDATSGSIILRTQAAVATDTEIRLYDRNGNQLYTRELTQGNYLNARLDGKGIAKGDYELVLEDETGKTIQPLEVRKAGVVADPREAAVVYLPTVHLNDRVLSVNYSNREDQRVVLRLLDRRGNEMFREVIKGEETIHQTYELSRLDQGDYSMEVTAGIIGIHSTDIRLD